MFESIDEAGEMDGFIIVNIDNIYLIEIDNSYIRSIIHKIDNPDKSKKIELEEKNGNLLIDFIDYIIEKNKTVEIELVNSSVVDIFGQIKVVTDKYIEVETLDEAGNSDGEAHCRIEDISMIGFSDN